VSLEGGVRIKEIFPQVFEKINKIPKSLLPQSDKNFKNPQYIFTMLMIDYAIQKENF